MGRPKRQLNPESFYHVMSRGNHKAVVFHEPADFECFLKLTVRYKAELGVLIHHYVLMPNHFHMLIRPNGPSGSMFMKKLKLGYALYYSAKYAKTGHVWQGRFKSVFIDTDEYLAGCGRYIEMNPVRAFLAAKPELWPYSSARHYVVGTHDPIIDDDPTYASLGTAPDARRANYAKRFE